MLKIKETNVNIELDVKPQTKHEVRDDFLPTNALVILLISFCFCSGKHWQDFSATLYHNILKTLLSMFNNQCYLNISE